MPLLEFSHDPLLLENKTNAALTIEDASSATWNLPGDREFSFSV